MRKVSTKMSSADGVHVGEMGDKKLRGVKLTKIDVYHQRKVMCVCVYHNSGIVCRHVLTRPKHLNAKDEYLGYEEKQRRAAERVSFPFVFVQRSLFPADA